jgi:hypothetical protein
MLQTKEGPDGSYDVLKAEAVVGSSGMSQESLNAVDAEPFQH